MRDPLRSTEAASVRVGGEAGGAGRDGSSPRASDRTAVPAAYPYKQRFTWWARRRGYLLYMIRELTAAAIALWMILFLIEIVRARQGAGGYQPLGGILFEVVSVVCLALALWHSYTFLSLAGLIMRVPIGDRTLSPRVIVAGAFGGFVVITALIAGLLIWGGM